MKTPLDIPSVVARYTAGVGLAVIGRTDHVSRNRLRAALIDAGVAIHLGGRNRSSGATLDIPSIIARYTAGVGLADISRADRTHSDRVRSVLVAAGVVIRPVGTNGPPAKPLDVAALVARYNAGETINNIARSVGRTARTLRGAFAIAGIPVRVSGMRKDEPNSRSRICQICDIGVTAMTWHEHQHEVHNAPATPTTTIRRNVAAYIAALETTPTPALPYCIGCRQRPCITPLCCGRRLRAQTQHANRKEIR